MTNSPFYTGQGCAYFSWRCKGKVDYTSQLVSVTGLELAVDFQGGIKSPQVQIVIAGGGLVGGDSIGDILTLELYEGGIGVSFGSWIISAIETTGYQVTITAKAAAAETVLNGDYNFYTALAAEPRKFAINWLSACSGISGISTPAYSDIYNERQYSRVAAPASTLAGLAGFANSTSRTGIRYGDQRSSGQWGTSFTYFNDIPITIDVQWDAAPGYNGNGSFLGNKPLYWHQRNQYWHITWTGRVKWPSVTTDKSQFPMGHTQYIALEVKCQGGSVSNPVTVLQPQDYNNPDTTQDVEVTFKSRKEAKDFYRANATWLPPADYGWGSASIGSDSSIKRWGGSRTVKLTNVSLYEGQLAPFYTASKAVIANDATTISAGSSDVVEFGERTMVSVNASATYSLQTMLAVASFQYIPQRMDSAWISIGVSGNANLHPGYEIIQDVYPITINQEYTTRDMFQQACALGSLAFYPAETPYLQAVDTCPEGGEVFALPLIPASVISVSAGQEYPMPSVWNIKFKDPHNIDRTYSYSDSNGKGSAAQLDIMQAALYPGNTPNKSGSNRYYSIGSATYQDNPGMLIDRWTASSYSGTTVTFPSGSGVQHYANESGLYLMSPDGQLWARFPNQPTGYSAASGFAVRTMENEQLRLFCNNGYINLLQDDAPPEGKYNDPLIDAYPLMSFLKAHARVFGENYNRQSFKFQVTMAFASVRPGDVVPIRLEQINDGDRTLGLVVGISITQDSVPIIEVVPMHRVTDADYTAWTNLRSVLAVY